MSVAMPSSHPIPVASARAREPGGGFFTHHGVWAPGVRLFRHLRFSSKALIISLAFTLPLLLVLGLQQRGAYDDAVQARMDATRQHVEIAHGLVAWAHAQEAAGQLPPGQGRATALRVLAGLRYDGNEYFWVNDLQPRVVMHPIKPELDGKDVSDMKDPNGLALFKAFVATVQKQGKGFVAYQWPKPGHDEPVDKVSYVMGFEPWGWVIGTGVYVGDLRQAALNKAGWTAAVVTRLDAAGGLPVPVVLPRDGRRPARDAPPPARHDRR